MSKILVGFVNPVGRRWCATSTPESVQKSQVKSKFGAFFQVPDRLKGTMVERWTTYWKDLFRDYFEVFKELGVDLKNKPMKATGLFTLFGSSYYCCKNNPDMNNFRSSVIKNANDFITIGPPIRNPKTANYLEMIEHSQNQDTLRRFSFGLFSIIWKDDYANVVGIYQKWCPYLRPDWFTFHTRILDVGFLNKWWILEEKMIDCDINPEEWGETVEN